MKLFGPIAVAALGYLAGVASAAEKVHLNDLFYFRGSDYPEPIQLNKCVKVPDGLTVQSARVESDNGVSCSGFKESDCTPAKPAQDLGHNNEVDPAIKSYKCA